ncbi:MAG: galactokinase [Pseudonocardiales bacterium]
MPKDRSVSWFAPGRVNLIGEHTDYNDGFALPFAIEQGATATVSVLAEPALVVTSAQRDDEVRLDLAVLAPGAGDWAGYAAGAAWVLRRMGVAVPGLRIALDSTVPTGAGLSSSAALVCSVGAALNDLLHLELNPAQLLGLTREVENDFVGAPTGGMDQLAALNCTEGNALFCDMRTVVGEQVPLPVEADGLAIVVVNTRAQHQHATGEYRARREACEQAAELLDVHALRDVPITDLPAALSTLPTETLRGVTRHVVTENDRVLRTVELLRADRLAAIGPLLSESHASLRDDYRVSIAELDVAVDTLLATGALGARMTGGGFGGSVIALLDAGRVDAASHAVTSAFADHDFTAPEAFTARPSRGAHRVTP